MTFLFPVDNNSLMLNKMGYNDIIVIQIYAIISAKIII